MLIRSFFAQELAGLEDVSPIIHRTVQELRFSAKTPLLIRDAIAQALGEKLETPLEILLKTQKVLDRKGGVESPYMLGGKAMPQRVLDSLFPKPADLEIPVPEETVYH